MAQKWTLFWKALDIKTIKRARTLATYSEKNDFNALGRIGITRAIAENIYEKSKVFGDPLFFHHLSLFFRRDPETARLWLNAPTKSDAFTKLFRLIDPGDRDRSKKKLSEISLVLKYHKKGEGRHFVADLATTVIPRFNPKALIMILNRLHRDARYKYSGSAKIGDDHLFAIQKSSPNAPLVFKFIKLSFQGKKIHLALSMDSSKEYSKAKKAIEKTFDVYFDSPQSAKSLQKFEDFLSKGQSLNFVLSGVTYFDDNFKVTVSDIYNRPLNVGTAPTYKRKIRTEVKKTEAIYSIRLFHREKAIPKPISINILSYRTAGIVGAIQFVLNDKNLSDTRRKKMKTDFAQDFGIFLNEYISYKDLDEKGIYRILLEGTPQRVDHIDLRSPLALTIYQDLLKDKLLQPTSSTEEQAKFCVNRNCEDRYRVVWQGKYCANCGEPLINGKRLITQTVDESSVVNYIKSAYKKGSVTKLANKLLKRNLYVAKIESGENVAEFIPLSTHLKDYQLEVIKFRYPDLVIVTSQDNLESYRSLGLRALPLYELVYNCRKGKSAMISDTLDAANASHLSHIRNLCQESVSRITNNEFYKAKNEISKYLGAEFFEADCSSMLNYVFGNCLWLGAKYRGLSVPDGFTAFPLHGDRNGCFIWDTKYGEGDKLHMGDFDKNKAYIEAARKNSSIHVNGGLKGFVFISNLPFPKKFEKKYRSLVKGKRLKMTFLSAGQLKRITEQYRKYENLISNNEKAKSAFMNAMETIFFRVNNGPNPRIIEDAALDGLLAQNQTAFKNFKVGKKLQYKR